MKKTDKTKTRISLTGLSIALILSIVCTFIFVAIEGSPMNLSNTVLNILYGILIGTSIGLGCFGISSSVFSREHWIEQPSKTFKRVLFLVVLYIALDVVVINTVWFYLTQGVSPASVFMSNVGIITMLVEFVIGMTIFLFFLSKNYAERLSEKYEAMAAVEKQAEKYRFETLKNQINPHFLFNTLNTLSGLIYINTEKADEFINRFANIYRYVLNVQDMDVVSLEMELNFVEDYIYLNNIRFDGQIELTDRIEDRSQFIIPMALQILLENAIKHNIFSAADPLKIAIEDQDGFLVIENNLNLREDNEPSYGLGIKNLVQRYASFSDQNIEIIQTKNKFTIRLPKLRID